MAILQPSPFAVDSKCNCMCTEYTSNFRGTANNGQFSKEVDRASKTEHEIRDEDKNKVKLKKSREIAQKLAWLDQKIEELSSGYHFSGVNDRNKKSKIRDLPEFNLQGIPIPQLRVPNDFAEQETGHYSCYDEREDSKRWSGDSGTWAPLPVEERWYSLRTNAFSEAHRVYLEVRRSLGEIAPATCVAGRSISTLLIASQCVCVCV